MNALENAKAGDYVAEGGNGLRGMNIFRIDRVTATQVVIGSSKWRKSDGRLVGDSSTWWARSIRLATEQDFIDARIQAAQRQIEKLRITAATLYAAETLIKVSSEIEAAKTNGTK